MSFRKTFAAAAKPENKLFEPLHRLNSAVVLILSESKTITVADIEIVNVAELTRLEANRFRTGLNAAKDLAKRMEKDFIECKDSYKFVAIHAFLSDKIAGALKKIDERFAAVGEKNEEHKSSNQGDKLFKAPAQQSKSVIKLSPKEIVSQWEKFEIEIQPGRSIPLLALKSLDFKAELTTPYEAACMMSLLTATKERINADIETLLLSGAYSGDIEIIMNEHAACVESAIERMGAACVNKVKCS